MRRIVIRRLLVEGEVRILNAHLLGQSLDAGASPIGTRRSRLRTRDVLGAQVLDCVFRRADQAVAWTGVERGNVPGVEALRCHSGGHQADDPRLFVVLRRGDAVDNAGATDERVDFVVADQLLGHLQRFVRARLVVLERVFDRPAVHAAIVVDACEVGLCRLRANREIADAGSGDDCSDRDWLSGCRFARIHPAVERECR